MTLEYQIALGVILGIVLISIQYTLNRILVSLKEINALLHLIVNRK